MPKSASQPVEENKVRTLVQSDSFKTAVAQVLPAHLTPDRFVRISIGALTRVPKLSECDPNTVLQCMMQLSQFGLEPDGRNAHLIPFWNSKRGVMECQLIIDYKGLVDLAMRSGKIAFVHADKVCENDVFKWNKGQVVTHEINFQEDRGKPYAYYALARMKDGTEIAEAMTSAEVQAIRKRSRAADSGPWVTDFDEMSKKTVFRRLSKWLQLSPEFREALEADSDALEELRFESAKPIITRAKIKNFPAAPVLAESEDTGLNPLVSGEARESTSQQASAVSQDSRGGGEPPKKKAESSNPTQAQSSISTLKPKPKGKAPSNEALTPYGQKQKDMLDRLALGNCTPEHLITVAAVNEWEGITKDSKWPLPEKALDKFLHEDNWPVIMEELDALKK